MKAGLGSRDDMPGKQFHRFMALFVVLIVAGDVVLARFVHLSGFSQLLGSLPGLLVLVAVYAYCRWRKYAKLEEISLLAIWAVLLTNFLGVLIQIAGRTGAPVVDGSLARIDAGVHFNAGALVHWISAFPALRTALWISYILVTPLIIAAVIVPTLRGHAEASRRYILAIIAAALITAALFAIWPAVGPWTVFGFQPARDQAAAQSYLLLLKSDRPVPMDFASSAIVAFPSFHVVLALLSVSALWCVRQVRWLALALGVAICISTLTTGWHYATDVLGGLAVTALAQSVAVWVMRRMASARATATPGAIASPAYDDALARTTSASGAAAAGH